MFFFGSNDNNKEESVKEKEAEGDKVVVVAESPSYFVILFTIVFRFLPLFFNFVFDIFFKNPLIIKLVTVFISGYIDFWFLKNISGRVLVGLFWYHKIEDSGKERIIYECKRDEKKNNSLNSKIFWFLLIFIFFVWCIIFFYNIISLSFNKSLICFNPFCFNLINCYCFYKCSDEQKEMLLYYLNRRSKKGNNNLINN